MLALTPAALGGAHDLLARALVLVVFTAGGLAALAALLSRAPRHAPSTSSAVPGSTQSAVLGLAGAGFSGVVGALLALQIGGPGALVWLVLACLAGAAIQGAEARLTGPLHEPRGTRPIGQALMVSQALAATFAALVAGAALHAQQVAEAARLTVGAAPWAIGLGLATLTALALRGSGRWLGPVALFGLAVHVALMLVLMFGDAAGLSRVLASMSGEAFGGAAAAGGVLGAAAQGVLRAGVAGATGGLGQAAALGRRGAWSAPLVTAAVALLTGLAAAVSGSTESVEVAGRELLALERPLRSGLAPSEYGQLVVLPTDAGLEEGQKYPVVLRADPRGHRYGELFRDENIVAAPGWDFTSAVDTVILRDKDPVRGANPGFDLRIPVTRELIDTKVGPFLKLRPVDPTINIRQLMTARSLVGPFLNIGDYRFEAGVLRGFKLAGGERMSLVLEPRPKDAPPSPALRDLITLNYAGPYPDRGEGAPPLALAAPVDGGLVPGTVAHLRLDPPARGLELGFVNGLGELEVPPWDFLAAADTAVLRHREDPALDRRIRVRNRLAFGRLRFWSDEIDIEKLGKLLPDHSGPYLEPPSYRFAVEVHHGARLPAERAETSLALIPMHPQRAPTGNPGVSIYRPHPGEVLLTGMTGPFRDQDAAGALLDALAQRQGRPLAGLGALALVALALAGLLQWLRAGTHPATLLLGAAAGPGFTALFLLCVALGPAIGLAPLLGVAEFAVAVAVLLGLARLVVWLPQLRRGDDR
jgi:Na+/alanine symporter